MIHLSSACPFPVAQIRWQPRPDLFAVTLVCKATFTLRPVESPLAPAQEEPISADLFWEDDPRASLRVAADFVPFKRHVDVLVVGHAHAPHGQPVSSLVARVAVGGIDKRVEVHGDRHWMHGGELAAGAPFMRMPLRWERAACGLTAWNPVGVSPGGLVPNLQPTGMVLRSPADAVLPIGLGPIAPRWPERATRLHRHAAMFRHEAWSEQPLPDDIDGAYFNAAPPDQQLAELAPGERLLLEHLHPEYPQLITVLEEVIPRAMAQRDRDEAQEIRMRCDTLCIDADQGTCALVWRGALILQSADEDLFVVVTASQRNTDDDADVVTLVPRARSFAATDVATTQAPGLSQGESGAAAEAEEEAEEVEKTISPALSSANAGLPFADPALPFAPQGEVFLRAPAEPRTSHGGPTASRISPGVDTGTVAAGLVPAPPALPFQQSAAPPPSPASAPHQAAPTLPVPPEAHVWVALPPPPPLMTPLTAGPSESPRQPTPVPPPLLGSSVSTMAAESLSEYGAQDEPLTAHPPSEPAAPALAVSHAFNVPLPLPEPEPEICPEDIPIERFAVITAEICEARTPRSEVLSAHGLSERAWAAVDRHWRAKLNKDIVRGGRLRAAHDAAYVTAVERLRGPITLPEYAQIAVALERGEASQALDELKIQRPALMPIIRVWTSKVSGNAKLSAEAMAKMAALRSE